MSYLFYETLVFSFISSTCGGKLKRSFKEEKILTIENWKTGILERISTWDTKCLV